MTGALIKGTILGGVVLFGWSTLSWTVLGLHTNSLLHFTNETDVAQVMLDNAPQPGIYTLPADVSKAVGMSDEQFKAAQMVADDRMKRGPELFAAVRLGGVGSMTPHIVIQVLTQFITAFLATLLLCNSRARSYWGRVAFVVCIALAGGVACVLPEWNWWSFSTAYTATAFADLLIGWFLAGLLLARFAK
jgi:hypothetical protein